MTVADSQRRPIREAVHAEAVELLEADDGEGFDSSRDTTSEAA